MNTNSQKDRVNAAISYFFLAPLFLLARHNPNLSHPFVRNHAKHAVRLLAFAGIFLFVHHWFLSDLLTFVIPALSLSLDRLVLLGAYGAYLLAILISAYRALHGQEASSQYSWLMEKDSIDVQGLQEYERVQIITAFIPVFSLFTTKQHALADVWCRTSTWFILIFIAVISFLQGDNVALVLLFGYVFLFVSTAVFLLMGKTPHFLWFATVLPSGHDVMAFVQTIPQYLWQVLKVSFNKQHHLNFSHILQQVSDSQAQLDARLKKYFTDSASPLSPYLIYIPGLNILFLPQYFFPGKSPHVLAVEQGIVLTLLFALGMWQYGPYSPILLFGLVAACAWIAQVRQNPFYRIPLLYELSWILSTISFGLLSGTKAAREKSQEVREVRLKV